MKKNLLFVLLLLMATSIYSQKWDFGAKAGLNFANLSGDETSQYDSRTGVYFGLFAENKFTDKFAFQPEILYSSQGVKFTEEGVKATAKVNYLNVPIMFKYYAGKQFSLDFGPQLGLLLDADADLAGFSIDLKEMMNDFDFGLNLGFGYEFSKFSINGRYNFGLTNIWNDEFDDGDVKNQNAVLQFGIGYKF